MIFTSLEFIFFLICVVSIYFLSPVRVRWVILLIFSIIFYCIAGIKYLPFILTTTVVSYLVALFISDKYEQLEKSISACSEKEERKAQKETCKKTCKRAMLVTLFVVLGILCYTKFTNLLLESLKMPDIQVIVPLGISYYTFSTVGYVLDVYWKRYNAEKNFFKYLLYVIYFPHILQGPIARYDRLAPQLFEKHFFDYKRVCFGIQLMLWGYFKKLVIADRLALFVNTVYEDWLNQKGFILLVATIFYAIQIYTDFSGCVDIARGVSQIFGIELENNFRQPYFSQSVAEFWRRWHITLGAWFRDYLCMPVSVSRIVKKWSKKARNKWGNEAGKNVVTISSLVVVWICTGLWHGTGLNYIIWAIWQGGIIIISILMEKNFNAMKSRLKIDDTSKGWQYFRIVRTFILTGIIPRVITRAESIPVAIGIFKNIFAEFNIWVFFDESIYHCGLDKSNFWLAIISIVILFIVSLAKEKGISIRESIAAKNIIIRWGIYYLAIFSILVFGIYGLDYDASSFVYMNF